MIDPSGEATSREVVVKVDREDLDREEIVVRPRVCDRGSSPAI
jgi:hypothetical protein